MSKFFKGTWEKSGFWEQFGISFRGTIQKVFGSKGDFKNFSREHGNTDPPGGLYVLSTIYVSSGEKLV